jgi:hypothetical protein
MKMSSCARLGPWARRHSWERSSAEATTSLYHAHGTRHSELDSETRAKYAVESAAGQCSLFAAFP